MARRDAVNLPSSPSRPDVVVGLGNEIARDDAVGIVAARRLERLLADRDGVEVVALPWAGFALLDVLAGRRRAALVDCLATGVHPPGTVVRLGEDDIRGSVRLNSFHDINFPTVLALGRRMGLEMPVETAIWAVEGKVMDAFGEGLSPEVAAAVDRVVAEVLAYLNTRGKPAGAGHPAPAAA